MGLKEKVGLSFNTTYIKLLNQVLSSCINYHYKKLVIS
jgi:hypothetical protein